LGVLADRRPEHLDTERAALRVGLRAKWRHLGRDRDLLVAECAYEQWHRLLFARFLAENRLLLHPRFKAPVTLADCEELAAELGEPDAWSVAARFAAEILPGIFKLDDPCVQLRLAPEGRDALERILDALPAETFATDDALGWVYQFWQKDKKDEVKASQRKIGGPDLGPLTQLFTENYMVRFLLENSLGAWWAARYPTSPLVADFDYLRFDQAGRPAAGSFDGWPDRVAEVTVMDPCCGSGHFLVEAFSMLWRMRAEEEGLTAVDAQDAVLRDNLFGLELDTRCVQIAMFSLAFHAWKAGGGWRQLPPPNIACSGTGVAAEQQDWLALAGENEDLRGGMERFHGLLSSAPLLGSLLDPTQTEGDLWAVEWSALRGLVTKALLSEPADPVNAVIGDAALGAVHAVNLLSQDYTLVATNVPYLQLGNQSLPLRHHLARFYPRGRADLATAFLERCHALASPGGCVATVSPQSWLTLGSFNDFRIHLLTHQHLALIAAAGIGAFTSISGAVVNVVLSVTVNMGPNGDAVCACLNVQDAPAPADKANALKRREVVVLPQAAQREHPDSRILTEPLGRGRLLAAYADSYRGLGTADQERFIRRMWEIPSLERGWAGLQTTPAAAAPYAGRSDAILWEDGRGTLEAFARDNPQLVKGTHRRGNPAWGKRGVLVSQMGSLPATLYSGDLFDSNAAALVPHQEAHLAALWAFCSSSEYAEVVRRIETSINVTSATLLKVPFDLERWQRIADQAGSLPRPCSDDPTQWLFEGRPEASTAPSQVAVARLVGYRWPEQPDADDLDSLADADGIVCLPSVAGEAPAADRVQQVLARAFGPGWSPGKITQLLEQVGSKKKSLGDWLRDEFFKQHCALFENRPFVWHIWDGLRDGFSALANYHRLDRKTLAKLIFTYLGQDWIERQRAEARDDVAGAEARLSAALALQRKLEAILEGEAPYDIFVRWKQAHEQPIGWDPDLNDGVRLNVRPFVEAGVLRAPFNIHWRKDRGKNPDGSERENDIHLTFAEKQSARKHAGES
jgi:hypothetical protein